MKLWISIHRYLLIISFALLVACGGGDSASSGDDIEAGLSGDLSDGSSGDDDSDSSEDGGDGTDDGSDGSEDGDDGTDDDSDSSEDGDVGTDDDSDGTDDGSDDEGDLNVDLDGDGLTDAEEAILGTSPVLIDTDGDGFNDYQEVINFGFNPDNNNFRFNPLIADVPKLRVEITSVPTISLYYEDSASTAVSSGWENTVGYANTVTTSDTSTNSLSVEETHSFGVELSAGVEVESGPSGGVTGSFTATVNYGYSESTTTESSFSYTEEQSDENSRSLSENENFEQTNGYTNTGGALAVNVQIFNDGDVAFRINSLVLGSVMIDSLYLGNYSPIGNLNLDTNFSNFSGTTLGPKSSTGDLVFNNDGLDVGTTKTLLKNASGVIVSVSSSDVVDEDGVGFAFRETDIAAKTASVIIDFGTSRASERYLVATNVDAVLGRVSVPDVMNTILRTPYTVATTGQLDSVRSTASDVDSKQYWVAIHSNDNGVTPTIATYSQLNEYDFEALELTAGDVLHLVYMQDTDLDGVGSREEFFAGTDPENADSDFDGFFTDYDELQGYPLSVTGLGDAVPTERIVRSNPLILDTDNDGISDVDEFDDLNSIWISDPTSADTDGDKMLDIHDPQPTVAYDLRTTANLATATNDGTSIDLSFAIPVIPDTSSVTYRVRRQEVALDDVFTLCADDYSCYTPVETGSLVDVDNVHAVAFTNLTTADRNYKYAIYLSVNGGEPIFVSEIYVTTAVSKQLFEIDVLGLTTGICNDLTRTQLLNYGIEVELDADPVCELYWTVTANDVVVSQVTEPNAVASAPTEGAIPLPEDKIIISVPILPGACITLEAKLWEKDDNNEYSRTGDDVLRQLVPISYCPTDISDWEGEPGGELDMLYVSRKTVSGIRYDEFLIFQFDYKITPVHP